VQANGFFGSKGVSKYIPPAYTFYEKLFWEAVVKKGLQDDIELREWNKEGWTYHAKGRDRSLLLFPSAVAN
jgi:CDP-diacylglycerol--glycerol-3-phosphate 3-phosphatidyltransferase